MGRADGVKIMTFVFWAYPIPLALARLTRAEA